MPVNLRSPPTVISPTDRCSGNVVPSFRRPVTSRPMPMIFAHAGREIPGEIRRAPRDRATASAC